MMMMRGNKTDNKDMGSWRQALLDSCRCSQLAVAEGEHSSPNKPVYEQVTKTK